ncbi:immune inhibitor A domain-containing protein [Neobacillus sp. LXY-4]|uniref:immune inhibitor A domain-containing protein n=1 Tax=Neobacillus sp. LXY-4 TaxID=3379826 RepID=UPI003EE2DC98
MKKGSKLKVFSSVTTAALLASSLAFTAGTVSSTPTESQGRNETSSYSHAPFDLGIANDERLIEMLKKQGVIPKNATQSQAEKGLQKYLNAKAANATSAGGDLHKQEKKLKDTVQDQLAANGLTSGKGNKVGKTKSTTVAPIEKEGWNGSVRKDNILVVLIEYPDFKASEKIQSGDTDMFYEEYTREHYQDMLFGGEDGYYKGPNGEKLISVKKYYEEQSGGSYTIGGNVVGWYEAKHPAAYYGKNVPTPDGNDDNPRELVKEAVRAAAAAGVNLNEYDKEDRYDLDGDGNTREPDGIIDHLMVVHSSVGEEAGGGALAGDAIWSHRSNLGGLATIPGTTPDIDYFGAGTMYAYDYTIEPADGAAGVFAHEYGHDLELPDEYDTYYSGAGEPVGYWSIMSSGSWAGKIPGTEPTGFSAYAKEFLQNYVGGNWLTGKSFNLSDINAKGTEVLLDEGASKGSNPDAIKIGLPEKEITVNTPYSGQYEYFSGSGDNLDHSMVASVDLTSATSAQLNFKTWYDIEQDWDYGSIQVKEEGSEDWVAIQGNITTTDNPNDQNPGHGITGKSAGWVDGQFDLAAYAGKKIELRFNYWSDVAVAMPGFYVDNISIVVNGAEVFFDDAEGDSKFTLAGFNKDLGKFKADHYYLLEWRSHNGVDQGLANIRRGASLMSYDSGLVVWYVDGAYSDNWTGIHPGEGFLGVVDADQIINRWSDGELGGSRYQMHDAAFNVEEGANMFLDYGSFTMKDNATTINPIFDDSKKYVTPVLPDVGRNVPTYGLKLRVLGHSADGSVGKILISK